MGRQVKELRSVRHSLPVVLYLPAEVWIASESPVALLLSPFDRNSPSLSIEAVHQDLRYLRLT